MATKVNKYNEIFVRLEQQGKIKRLNTPADRVAMREMNTRTAETKKEYHAKEANSQIAAAQGTI